MPSLDAGSRAGEAVSGNSTPAPERSPKLTFAEPTGYDVLVREMRKLRGFDAAFLRGFAERPKIWFYLR